MEAMVTRCCHELSHCRDCPRDDLHCIERHVHSVVSRFALRLDSSLLSGALKLFDEVLVKQKAARLRVRSSVLLLSSHRQTKSRPFRNRRDL